MVKKNWQRLYNNVVKSRNLWQERAETAEQVWQELSTAVGCSSPTGQSEIEQVVYLQELLKKLESKYNELDRRLKGQEEMRSFLDVVGSSQGRVSTEKYTKEFQG